MRNATYGRLSEIPHVTRLTSRRATSTLATIAIAVITLAAVPSAVRGQTPPSESELRSRVRDMVVERDAQGRGRDGRWDWDRARDGDRRRDDDWRRDEDRRDADRRRDSDRRRDDDWRRDDDRGRGRGIGWGWGWGRNDEWRTWEREQRDFERRSRHWNRWQWDRFRDCERDLWRRSRWDRNDSRREALRERSRIRDYCERLVQRW